MADPVAVITADCRGLQDKIVTIRLSNAHIPDWLDNLRRDHNETLMPIRTRSAAAILNANTNWRAGEVRRLGRWDARGNDHRRKTSRTPERPAAGRGYESLGLEELSTFARSSASSSGVKLRTSIVCHGCDRLSIHAPALVWRSMTSRNRT